jgi:hypothetical protein
MNILTDSMWFDKQHNITFLQSYSISVEWEQKTMNNKFY